VTRTPAVGAVRPTAVDLFSGAGGLSLGLHQAGFDVVGAVDSWRPAIETYGLNFAHPVLDLDLANVTAHDLVKQLHLETAGTDLVVGGPPCQGFSIQRIGADDDARNDLVLHFADLVLGLRPKLFLMENVPGLLGRRGRRLAAAFEDRLRAGGYVVTTRMINAVEYGVPQFRRRVFVMGVSEESELSVHFPPPTHATVEYRTVWDAIGDLPSPMDKMAPDVVDPLHVRTGLSELNLRRIRLIPPGGGFEDLPPALRVPAHRNGAARIGHRNVYGRLDPAKPSVTITARFDSFTRGKFGHPYEDRTITLREGARLQTFPDHFRFAGSQEEIAALIGNAVPPQLAHAIGVALVDSLATGGQGSLSSSGQLRMTFEAGDRDSHGGTVGRVTPSNLSTPS
jgi:DNA (cytosine-5)-methyltransferase 1